MTGWSGIMILAISPRPRAIFSISKCSLPQMAGPPRLPEISITMGRTATIRTRRCWSPGAARPLPGTSKRPPPTNAPTTPALWPLAPPRSLVCEVAIWLFRVLRGILDWRNRGSLWCIPGWTRGKGLGDARPQGRASLGSAARAPAPIISNSDPLGLAWALGITRLSKHSAEFSVKRANEIPHGKRGTSHFLAFVPFVDFCKKLRFPRPSHRPKPPFCSTQHTQHT